VLAKFNRLIQELRAGNMQRSKFETWEIDILLDVAHGDISPLASVDAILGQYQDAVHRQLAHGATVPMKLSDFLKLRREATAARRRMAQPNRGHRVCSNMRRAKSSITASRESARA